MNLPGGLSPPTILAPVVTILDVKCPGSGEADRMDWENLTRLRRRDEVKFVIKDRADYDYARSIIDRFGLGGRVAAISRSSFCSSSSDSFVLSVCTGA